MAEKKQQPKKELSKFPKEKLIESKKYVNRKDVLNVLLENGKEYSFDEVDKAIDKFMKGKVK